MNIFHHQRMGKSGKTSPCNLKKWDFPHVIGALDGKYVRIECPKLSGSLHYSYKEYFSMVLLKMCDANYCSTLFDFGSYGSNNDCGILSNLVMGEAFQYNNIDLPDPKKLQGCRYDP